MNTSEVLNKAADLIEVRGWTKGEGWRHENGGPLCLEGAIAAAMGISSHDLYGCPAFKAVREYLSAKTDKLPFIWNDNLAHEHVQAAIDNHDYAARRFDMPAARAAAHEYARGEVIATLRAAAVIEAAKGAGAGGSWLGRRRPLVVREWNVMNFETGKETHAVGERLTRLCPDCRVEHKKVGILGHDGECGSEAVKSEAIQELADAKKRALS